MKPQDEMQLEVISIHQSIVLFEGEADTLLVSIVFISLPPPTPRCPSLRSLLPLPLPPRPRFLPGLCAVPCGLPCVVISRCSTYSRSSPTSRPWWP